MAKDQNIAGTDRDDPQRATACVKCGHCGLPVHINESGIRYFGLFVAHSEHRCISLLHARIERLERALQRIARWHGEFPPTGRFWDEPENNRPMGYSAAFGSNGERDFMRQIALDALEPPK